MTNRIMKGMVSGLVVWCVMGSSDAGELLPANRQALEDLKAFRRIVESAQEGDTPEDYARLVKKHEAVLRRLRLGEMLTWSGSTVTAVQPGLTQLAKNMERSLDLREALFHARSGDRFAEEARNLGGQAVLAIFGGGVRESWDMVENMNAQAFATYQRDVRYWWNWSIEWNAEKESLVWIDGLSGEEQSVYPAFAAASTGDRALDAEVFFKMLAQVAAKSKAHGKDPFSAAMPTLYQRVGVRGMAVDAGDREQCGTTRGVYVVQVTSGSLGEDGGLMVGDVITAIDGIHVATLSELRATIDTHVSEKVMRVTYLRGGKERIAKIDPDYDGTSGGAGPVKVEVHIQPVAPLPIDPAD